MNKDIIAKRLREYRGNRNREDVAKQLKISISALQMYETGQRIPRDGIKVKIAKLYGASVQEIFFNSKNHKKCSKEKAKEVI